MWGRRRDVSGLRGLKILRGEDRYPFSAGEIVEAMQGAGVPTDAALQIARGVEKQLRAEKVLELELPELVGRLGDLIRKQVSPEAAQRFRTQTPPFVPLMVSKDGSDEPLSRRTLSHSLEKLGLSFKEAYAVASQAEQRLRTQGYETVPAAVLSHVVALALEAGFGRELRLRYDVTVNQPVELEIVERDGGSLPFSRGVLARSIMAVGLGPELAYGLARQVEDLLWRSGERPIPQGTVRSIMTGLLRDEAGEEFARRYQLLHSLRSSGEPVIVLVGGASGVGKSTIASELAYRLGISRLVSSDSVREALRSLIGPELSPVLHSSTYTAWKADLLPGERDLLVPKRKRVLRGYLSQVQQLGPALTGIINRTLDEAASLVMEGIHLVPGVSVRNKFAGAAVVQLVLVVEDEEDHRNHFALREQQTNDRRLQEAYLNHFREVRFLQDFLIQQAKAEGVAVIDATDLDQAVDAALEHVLSSLLLKRLVPQDSDE
jgi:2-phosphoglycerate kinase